MRTLIFTIAIALNVIASGIHLYNHDITIALADITIAILLGEIWYMLERL